MDLPVHHLSLICIFPLYLENVLKEKTDTVQSFTFIHIKCLVQMYFLVNKYDINRQFEYTFYLNRAQPFTAKNHGKAGARNSGYSSFKSKLA